MIIADKQNYTNAKPMMIYYKGMLTFYKFGVFCCSCLLTISLFTLKPTAILISCLLGFVNVFMHKHTYKTMKNKLREHKLTIAQYYATKKQLKIEKKLEKIKQKTLQNQKKLDTKHETEILNYTNKSTVNKNTSTTLNQCEKILTASNPENLKTNLPLVKQMIKEMKANKNLKTSNNINNDDNKTETYDTDVD